MVRRKRIPSNTKTSLFRMIDANANRALEGLRVCEDVARFHWGDAASVRRVRALRHAVARAVRALPVSAAGLAEVRAGRRDVGRRAAAEAADSLERVLVVNLQRAKEALRVLEECCRMVGGPHSAAFQRLRFQAYEVERGLLLRVASLRHR